MTVILFAERGDLLSYEFLDDIDKETAQNVLNGFIPTAPNVIYDLEMYSVTYETIDQFGPDGFAKLVKFFSNKAVQFQNGYIYHYAFVMLLGFSILLTYLIII